MGDPENRTNPRNKEDSVPVRQEEAAKTSADKSTVIAPSQSPNVWSSGDAAAALNDIRTGGGVEDSLDSRKARNVTDLDVGRGDGSSSSGSTREKMRKISHNVEEDDYFPVKNTVVLPCHDSDISKGPDKNPSCNDLQLEYVKPLINNVNGSVMIPSNVVNSGGLPYSRTLYGFFIEEKEMAFSLVDDHMRNMWKRYSIEDTMTIDKGFYLFKFKTDQGMLDALEQGPWTIDNVPIFLKRWTPGLILDKSKHDKLKLPVWIKIYGMPLELWNKDGLNIVASVLGNPLAIDSCTARICMNASGTAGYARVLVDVEATGNWVDEVSVSVPHGNGYSLCTLQIEYSWKPAKCSFCKVFDHSYSNCTHQKVMPVDKANEFHEISLKKEEEREEKRRYKAQPHLYTIIKVAREEDLLEQIGKDIYFDLVDHENVRSFYINKKMPFKLFKEKVAKEFGIPVQFQRFWIWAKRQNRTYRPNRPLTEEEETQTVGQLREVSSKYKNAELKLFLEIEIGPNLNLLPPPDKSKDDILLFFKLYCPEKEKLPYVGRLFVKNSGKPTEIISKLNERAGFSPDEELELYEELKFLPIVTCDRLDKTISFRSSQIEDGDIICFQKLSQAQALDKYLYPDLPSFLEYVKSQAEAASTKKNQAFEELQASKFTWTIENFSRLTCRKMYSDIFVVGGCKWSVLLYPKGNNVDHLSMYLDVADTSLLPYGWSRYAQFSFSVVNQIHNNFTVKKDTQHMFNSTERDWGFTTFMALSDLHDPSKGFIMNDSCIIEADVVVRS